jgi:hypothetical protein
MRTKVHAALAVALIVVSSCLLGGLIYVVKVVPGFEEGWHETDATLSGTPELAVNLSHFGRLYGLILLPFLLLGIGGGIVWLIRSRGAMVALLVMAFLPAAIGVVRTGIGYARIDQARRHANLSADTIESSKALAMRATHWGAASTLVLLGLAAAGIVARSSRERRRTRHRMEESNMADAQPSFQANGTSGLAIASLILSCLTVVAGPFGCIPGIVCGHLARAKCRKNPALTGSGMATAGLIIGYSLLAFGLLAAFVLFALTGSPDPRPMP